MELHLFRANRTFMLSFEWVLFLNLETGLDIIIIILRCRKIEGYPKRKSSVVILFPIRLFAVQLNAWVGDIRLLAGFLKKKLGGTHS